MIYYREYAVQDLGIRVNSGDILNNDFILDRLFRVYLRLCHLPVQNKEKEERRCIADMQNRAIDYR